MVARWRPPHVGHTAVLRALLKRGREAWIGIGSSNRYNARNPFTFEETSDMLRLILEGDQGYHLLAVPDLDDGPRWREMVRDLYGSLDLFVTANPYVAHLLKDTYRVLRPLDLIPFDERVAVEGAGIRAAMARGDGWQALVPDQVADYIIARGLDARFRREFGLETLALETLYDQPTS